jgi:hypothetical protein
MVVGQRPYVGIVQGRRRREAALNDHALSISVTAVTGGAINLEALPTSVEELKRDLRCWKLLCSGLIGLPRGGLARDGVVNTRAGRCAVGEKRGGLQRAELGL